MHQNVIQYLTNSSISVNALNWEKLQINKIFITSLFLTLTNCTYFLRFLNWYFNKAPLFTKIFNIYYIIRCLQSNVYKITYQPSAISTYYITESLWLRSTIHSSFLVSEFIYINSVVEVYGAIYIVQVWMLRNIYSKYINDATHKKLP